MKQFRDTKMGFPLNGTPEFKLFSHSCFTHKIFRVGKFEEKIIFDKIWGCQNKGVPLK